MALRLERGELSGKGTKEERGVLEGEVKYCVVREEHGIPLQSVHQVLQQGSAFAGQIPVPQPNLTSWKLRKEVGKQKEWLPPSLVLHTNPSSTGKIQDLVFSQHCALLCYSLLGCCCTGFSMMLHSSSLS